MQINTSNIAGSERADQIQADARAAIEAIRSDRNLSAEGRKAQIAEVYRSSEESLARLRAEVEKVPRERRATLERRLFGTALSVSGSDAISYRDAFMRASQLEDEDEAQHLLDLARVSGDQVLASAVAREALRRSWVPTLEVWANGDAHLEDQLSEMLALDTQLADQSFSSASVANGMAADLVFHLPRPAEITAADAMSMASSSGDAA